MSLFSLALVLLVSGCVGSACDTCPAKSVPSHSGLTTTTISVNGLTCTACSIGLRAVLLHIAGVSDAQVDAEYRQVIVAYDPTRVRPEQIVAVIRDSGYQTGTPVGR